MYVNKKVASDLLTVIYHNESLEQGGHRNTWKMKGFWNVLIISQIMLQGGTRGHPFEMIAKRRGFDAICGGFTVSVFSTGEGWETLRGWMGFCMYHVKPPFTEWVFCPIPVNKSDATFSFFVIRRCILKYNDTDTDAQKDAKHRKGMSHVLVYIEAYIM